MASRREIKLLSPVGAEAAVFHWPLTPFDGKDGFEELRVTFNFVCDDIPELRLPCQNILSKVDHTSFESVKESCERFNRAVSELQRMWKGTSCSKTLLERHKPTNGLLKHILSQCYYRAVTDPEKLNQYPPFSPEVYGETSFELVERMVSKIKWGENGTFIDLGSGVGQVVLQVAAMIPSLKMAYGVERADLPSVYAKALDTNFRFWMAWYGKSHSDYQLIKDDFLTQRWSDVINEADVVFANNFAFGPQVNHELKQRLQHMKEGSKIVSSLSLCPLKFEISERNLSDIGAILKVEELAITPNTQAVSWTGRDFSFYLHTVDRTMLEKYFERKARHRQGNGSVSHSSASSVNSEDSMASAKSHHSKTAVESVKETSNHGVNSPLANGSNNHTITEPEKKKKIKEEAVPNGATATVTAHRGRGRPAKIPRVSTSTSPPPGPSSRKSSLKASLRGSEEQLLEKTKRKHHRHEKSERETSEPSPKKALRMPPGLDWLYHAGMSSTSHPDTREGRIDVLLSKIKAKMIAFLENTTTDKASLQKRLDCARQRNAELKENEKKVADELERLTADNQTKLKLQVGTLSSLADGNSNAPNTASEFIADAKRIVDRNRNLRDLVSKPPATTVCVSTPCTVTPPQVAKPSTSQTSIVSTGSTPLAPFQTMSASNQTLPPPRPPMAVQLNEQQQQQAAAVFNSTLVALLPYYGQNPNMALQFMQGPPQELMRHVPGPPGPPMMMPPGPPGAPHMMPGGPWFTPMQPPMMMPVATPQPVSTPSQMPMQPQQQQPPPPPPPSTAAPPTTTSSSSSSSMNILPSVAEALKAIMATAVSVTDKKKNRHQTATPQLHHESSNQGSTTPDVTKSKGQNRRTPNKNRNKQHTPTTDPSPSRHGEVSTPTPTQLSSADMADFLSHLRLPEPSHPRPAPSAATTPVSSSVTIMASPTTSGNQSVTSAKPSGPVLHISNMIFRPGTGPVCSTPAPSTTPGNPSVTIQSRETENIAEAPTTVVTSSSPPSSAPTPGPAQSTQEVQPSVA